MNIKAMWFYAALVSSGCVGAGVTAAVSYLAYPVPAVSERDCAMTDADRDYMRSRIIRSPARRF